MVQPSHLYIATGKNTALTIRAFVGTVMSLLFNTLSSLSWSSQVAQMVKNLLVMQEIQVRSLDAEDPLEKGMGNPLQYSCLENSRRFVIAFLPRNLPSL